MLLELIRVVQTSLSNSKMFAFVVALLTKLAMPLEFSVLDFRTLLEFFPTFFIQMISGLCRRNHATSFVVFC